jgi:hypothetical protein
MLDFTRESDAIWRIYAPNKDGVRVTSTPRKLLSALYKEAGTLRDVNSFIGKVEYWSTKKLIGLLSDGNAMRELLTDSSGRGSSMTLLFKRIPFNHEKEIRLIYNSDKALNSDIFRFRVDPHDLFDDIVFDPRMDYSLFQKYKKRLKNLHYTKRIVQSTLYHIPKLKFRFNSKL